MSHRNVNARAEYARKRGENLSLAIANLASAVEEFCEQEPREVRSYPFSPSAAEKEAVKQLIAQGKANQHWKTLIDVDKLEGRNTRWIRVEMPSSAEFVCKFSCPNSPESAFQGEFEHLEIRESCV